MDYTAPPRSRNRRKDILLKRNMQNTTIRSMRSNRKEWTKGKNYKASLYIIKGGYKEPLLKKKESNKS